MISLLEWQFLLWASAHASVPLWLFDQNADILFYILYLLYKMKFSNGCRPGWEYFKSCLTVSSDSTQSVKAVDLRNKKKKMEKWAYFTIRQMS